MMPYPFARGVFIYGEPIYVKGDVTDAEMNEARSSLEETLKRITDEADRYFT